MNEKDSLGNRLKTYESLTTSTMPSHTHNIYQANGTGGGTDRGVLIYQYSASISGVSGIIAGSGGSSSHTHSLSSTSHTHTLTPPYYSLIYLVKLP